ncbi:hypothetical protein SISSUDRAFT_1058019 [Sistotremastrum suecicum HHB10207 ss-3]|nr:hypothetical protein SISSUDRAFT_1058019 [Sistotremastrum suecicum HHB10207 ss-3]
MGYRGRREPRPLADREEPRHFDEVRDADVHDRQIDGRRRSDPSPWRDHSETWREFGSQATDTLADISESAIDSAFSTLEALKAKMAEHRAQRERMEKEQRDRRFV